MSLKRKRSSDGQQVFDFLPQTSGEENEIPARKKKRTEQFDQQVSSKGQKCSSSSDKTQITSSVIGQKRKRCSDGTPVCGDTIQNTKTTSGSVDKGEIPVKKKRKNSSIDHTKSCVVKISDRSTDGNILSRYKIGRLLGEGGCGRVYKGTRLEDGLKVAVKIANKIEGMESIVVPGHPKPLPMEIGLMLMVNTEPKLPEIIQLLDWQDEPDRYIMILERPSPCKDLFHFILYRGEPLQEEVARFIMIQATKAARFCCRRGVFHRDIKMENLLVNTETLEVKLIDFSCGDLLRESGYETFMGTEAFCPPEFDRTQVYHGKPATVWSLGILLFNMVCGRFSKLKDRQMLHEGVWSKCGLSNECCDLIQALVHKYPRQRMDLGKILRHEWFKVKK